jgi:hypothetical protein
MLTLYFLYNKLFLNVYSGNVSLRHLALIGKVISAKFTFVQRPMPENAARASDYSEMELRTQVFHS